MKRKEKEGLAESGRGDRDSGVKSISVRAGPVAAYFSAVVLL